MGYKTSSIVETGGLPMHIVKPLLDACKIEWFIETGTAGGQSVLWASNFINHCHTIELIGEVKEAVMCDNIVWHNGDSVEILPKIIDELIYIKNQIQDGDNPVYNYALFFLDAHYSGSEPNDTGYPECPLLQELEIVSRYSNDAIIIIDDLRLFIGQPPAPCDPREWPTLNEIFVLLNDKFPYNTNTIRDDYILSYPDRLNEIFDKEWRENFNVRYPNAESKLKSQVKDVWDAFDKYFLQNKK